jgi:hypothetical protein
MVLTVGAALVALFGISGAIVSLALRELFITCVNVWLARDWLVRARG